MVVMKSGIKTLLVLLLINSLCTVHLLGQEDLTDYYPPSPVPDRIVLTVTEHPNRSIGVNWRTSLSVNKSFVHVTKVDASPNLATMPTLYFGSREALMSDKNGAIYHHAIIDDLESNTMYAYRVGDSTHWSEWSHFTTAGPKKDPVTFIYLGDAQNDLKSLWSRAMRGAYSKMPKADFIIHAGDLVNKANRDHEWGEWFYGGGWIFRTMPSIATPGNHEYALNMKGNRVLSNHWNPTFTFPENGPEKEKETVYYVDYQDTRIISLNTNTIKLSKEQAENQARWLRKVLSNCNQKWTIVTMHHPIYSSKLGRDNRELKKYLQPIFDEFKVDLVLQGHDHTYGRGSKPNEDLSANLSTPMYVVSVSGPKMYDLGLEPWAQRSASNAQLYQIISIDGDVLNYKAYTVNDKLYDEFEIVKNTDGECVVVDKAPEDVEELLDVPPTYFSKYLQADWQHYKDRYKAYKKRQKERAQSQ